MKETGQDNTTTSTLHVESLTEDQFYTCRVQSNQEYSSISKIEVNGNLHWIWRMSVSVNEGSCVGGYV